MPDTRRKSGPSGPHRHLIGGEYDGKRHEAGDKVSRSVPADKLKEWLDAGLIEPERPQRPRKVDDDPDERKR